MSKITIYHGRIYQVEGFISPQEVESLLAFATQAPDEDWFNEDFPAHWNGKTLPTHSTADNQLRELLQTLDQRVLSYVSNPISSVQISDIHRFRQGDTMGAHVDNAGDDYNNVLGAIIYLNEDFQGGALYYPTLGFSIQPKANSLVLHDASLLHQVLEVTEGIRYTLTTFIEGNETTKFSGGQHAI